MGFLLHKIRKWDWMIATGGLSVLWDILSPVPLIFLLRGRRRQLLYLKMAGVDGFFEAAVCGDEVAHAKPAPDIFLAAAKALGVPAEECLVLEDSPNGLRAARAAGCKAVVVPDITPIPPESEGLWAARAATLADVIPLLECL